MSDTGDPHANFTGLASVYHGARPGYPPVAIAAILDGLPAPAAVADVGSGTGISTRLLVDAGAGVVGVEPNVDMLGTARAQVPGATFKLGSAEDTGLEAERFDVVTCFQAFHWFDADRALAEFARILRPGGRVALVWNVRDVDRDAMTKGYQEAVGLAQDDAIARGVPVRRDREFKAGELPGFTGRRELRFENPQVVDRNGLLRRAASASYFPRSGPLRDRLEAKLLGLFDAHVRDGVVAIAQCTHVTLAERA